MFKIQDRRAIIDRRHVGGLLTDIANEGEVQKPAARAKILACLKDALKTGQAEIKRRFEEEAAPGLTTAKTYSYLIDQILRTAYDFTITSVYSAHNPTSGERLSVVAVGGYGRGDMAPFSDVDLLFLLPYKQTPWGETVVEYLLYLLWDLGLKVGHATRNNDECIRLSMSDTTIRTAILEARYICGDENLFADMRVRFANEVVKDTGPEFAQLKLAERDERLKRFGNSRYLVEPNIKEGKGGLRDIHTLFWICKYYYQIDDVAKLVKLEVLTKSELKRFLKAEEFLWKVRCQLHFLANRPEERLTFDVQTEIGRRLGYADRKSSSGVERFMKHYYLIAKEVGDLTRIVCASLEEQHKRINRFRFPRLASLRSKEIDGFLLKSGRLELKDDNLFETDPVALIRLFHLAHEQGADIHPGTLKKVTRSLKRIDSKLQKDPEANRLFMELLASKDNPESVLRHMNEAGVLGRFVPDFGRVVAQMQHDMYHVYTVDEHSIRAIGMLAQIEAGELEDEHPLSHLIIHKVLSRRVLYTSVLLHDIAKGRGGDHAVLGAKIANKLCPRFGLTPEETETVAWLVLHHLDMSRTAFKRDVQDPKTILDFTDKVQDLERLRLLLILTVADIRAVGPGTWNGWKGQLLRELFYRAEEALSGGMSGEGAKARVEYEKQALAETLKDWPQEQREKHLSRFYDSYWLSANTTSYQHDAELMLNADANDEALTIDARADKFQSVTEVIIYTSDHPGLFSRFAGAIAVAGMNVVRAAIFTTTDGMALDTFWVQEADGKAVTEARRIKKLKDTFRRTLAGEIRIRENLDKQNRLPSRTQVFNVAQRVLIDNKASNVYTVVEVSGRDRRGFLHDVTRAFADLGLTVASARIATYGTRASDVFYVKDVFGLKVEHEGKLEKIRERLLEVLEISNSPEKAKPKAKVKSKAKSKPKAA